ncbi:hypothetical protein NLL40_05900 [Corynebacterium accolens]|uniref:hypothetical protein n=1 Tax=Corynebacterium accolens TaxID=38284 RepID=UPI00266EEB33|nr:hypothetical protein [Corynebacterium accolens]WKS70158.1 hypothetical protein NLL40_05900 [Corynebacterium accolens]
MDLSTIQMHLDNFVNTWEGWNVNTWEGWNKVLEGLHKVFNYNWDVLKEVPGELSSLSSESK